MEGTAIFQEFLNYLTFEKRFSEHTAKCYGADLTQFGEFLTWRSGDGPIAEVISPENQDYGAATE